MLNKIKSHILDVPDFPKKGVIFRDITPLLSKCFMSTIEELAKKITVDEIGKIDALVGIESRGFIFASALAAYLNKNVVLIRKTGKLPPPVVAQNYQLEYGADQIEIKKGVGNIFLVDDVLATGGTFAAAASLCEKAGYNVIGFLTLIDLQYLNKFEWNEMTARSLIQYL